LERLGVEHIAAYSPQRAGTLGAGVSHLAGSTGKELALKEIDTVEAANLFLCDVYIPDITPGSRSRLTQEWHGVCGDPGVDLRRFMRPGGASGRQR